MVGHVASGCTGLTRREYKRRHDRMGLRVYWKLCRKYGEKCVDVWYKEVLVKVRVLEDDNVEKWWDRSTETAEKMENTCNRPDITGVDRAA